MRRVARSVVLPLAVALAATGAVLPARAAEGDAVLPPRTSFQKPTEFPGGDTDAHTLVTRWGDPATATLYDLSDGTPTSLGEFARGTYGHLFRPVLLGGTLALPVAGESVHTPESVTFREISSGDETTLAIGAGELVLSYAGAGAIVVSKPDAADSSRSDLYVRTAAGDDKFLDDVALVGATSRVIADATGALVYDTFTIRYVDLATDEVRYVDDNEAPVDENARPVYLTATEIGYRNDSQLVRVPRAGGAAVRVPYAGQSLWVGHVGDRYVLVRYAHPHYELTTMPDTGGAETLVPVALSSNAVTTYGTGEVAVFGTTGGGTYGRLAVTVATGATRLLVALPELPAAPHAVELAGGRLYVADEHTWGGELTRSDVDPAASSLAFGARGSVAPRPWTNGSCNGNACGPVAAFGSRVAFVQEQASFLHDGDLVVLDGTTEIARIDVPASSTSIDLGSDHLLYRVGVNSRLRDLRTGADAPTTLHDLWARTATASPAATSSGPTSRPVPSTSWRPRARAA